MLVALMIAISMSPTNVVPRDAQSTLDASSSPSGSPDTGSPTETKSQMTERTSNNLCNVYLEPGPQKKI